MLDKTEDSTATHRNGISAFHVFWQGFGIQS